ncbi:MAG TPA: peptidoglycan-binding domain-containing protein [Pilimelia sp.]|nr:peptidoglycan-binding domain-containing protein [Pilimelia sp.]
MKRIMAVFAAVGMALAASVVAATPASAALPTCYRQAPLDTGHIGDINVPSAGTTASSTSCILKRGHRNAAVKRLQQNLNVCFNGADIADDGVFGPQTEAALERTQRALGIEDDGVYGPVTRDRMPWWAGGAGCWRVNGPGGL